ncbi:hypothetical protein JW905_08540 [bacterium]|nr:hypothetical protein [candidate division CSSED10-310 bacterium]
MIKRGSFAGLTVLLLSVLVALSGCGDAGGIAKNRAPVFVTVTDIDPQIVNSDVCIGSGENCDCAYSDDTIDVSMLVRAINFNDDDPASGDTRYMDVIINRYKVTYRRTDTGYAVPATFTENCSYYLEAGDTETTITCRILRAEQKSMIPLSFLNTCDSFGYEPETGLYNINCTAEITFYGRTISGHSLSWGCQVPVTFADYGA